MLHSALSVLSRYISLFKLNMTDVPAYSLDGVDLLLSSCTEFSATLTLNVEQEKDAELTQTTVEASRDTYKED